MGKGKIVKIVCFKVYFFKIDTFYLPAIFNFIKININQKKINFKFILNFFIFLKISVKN